MSEAIQVTEQFAVPADTGCLKASRDKLATFLSLHMSDECEIQGFLLAFDEALTNAIQHGSLCAKKPQVTVSFAAYDDRIEVVVCDGGAGWSGQPPEDCGPMSTSGRGIFLMNSLVDAVRFERGTECGTRVTLIKNL